MQTALTPLLDTLFLLLFAVLATSRADDPARPVTQEEVEERVTVQLPIIEEGEGDAESNDDVLVVTLRAQADSGVDWLTDGGAPLRLDGPADLQSRLAALATPGATSVRIEIEADGDTPHGVVLDLLQTARTAGVGDVHFIATLGAAQENRAFGERLGEPR